MMVSMVSVVCFNHSKNRNLFFSISLAGRCRIVYLFIINGRKIENADMMIPSDPVPSARLRLAARAFEGAATLEIFDFVRVAGILEKLCKSPFDPAQGAEICSFSGFEG